MLGLFLLVPLVITLFHKLILPTAPNTEIPFLLVIGLLAAHASHEIGVHYLAGSFLVGFIARRYLERLRRERVGAVSVEQALSAVRVFASFFVPFFSSSSDSSCRRGRCRWTPRCSRAR
jgi:Kef-type K+ transport system membrane component KefB